MTKGQEGHTGNLTELRVFLFIVPWPSARPYGGVARFGFRQSDEPGSPSADGQTYLPECLPWASLQGSSRRGSSPEDTVAGRGLLDGSGTRSSLAANLRR